MDKRVIFAVGKDKLSVGGEEYLAVVIERQVSYFADRHGLSGLLTHLRHNPWVPLFAKTWNGFDKDNQRNHLLVGTSSTKILRVLFAL